MIIMPVKEGENIERTLKKFIQLPAQYDSQIMSKPSLDTATRNYILQWPEREYPPT